MFIAHLPAGYILTTKVQNHLGTRKYLLWGIVGSVLPDIDLLWFYFIDNQQTLHHDYWLHVPIFWICVAVLCAAILFVSRKYHEYFFPALLFFAGITLHLLLDTVAGGVMWLYPFVSESYVLITVPSSHGWWVWNFVFHWSFLLELAIITWAALLFAKRYRVTEN